MNNKQKGLTLIEILITITIAGILIASMQSLLSLAFYTEKNTHARNNGLQQGRFAMQLMIKSIRMSQHLLIPLAENSTTAHLESNRNVLAVTLDPTLDRDKDGWADANNDKDYLDINNNNTRDLGEPERIDEDPPSDLTHDNASGIVGIDDNGDGIVDNGIDDKDDDEDGFKNEDPVNGIDDDDDGSIDEDPTGDLQADDASGLKGFDDDFDSNIDEDDFGDDDEDGVKSEDWLDPVVFFLNNTTLIQRVPNINPSTGADYQENPIAENVSLFQVIRTPQGGGNALLIKITLELTSADGERLQFNAHIRVGSGL